MATKKTPGSETKKATARAKSKATPVAAVPAPAPAATEPVIAKTVIKGEAPVKKKVAKLEVTITLSHDQIAARAYAIWVAKGKPQGQDAANWAEAEAQLQAELAAK